MQSGDLRGARARPGDLRESSEQNKAILRRLIETGLGAGRLDLVDELVAPDSREHQRGNGQGREGAREVFEGLRRAFPDLRVDVLHLDGVEDRAWIHFRASGTHTGPFFDRLTPTGKRFAIDVFDLVRIEDGRIVEHWGVPDQLGMLEQLGVLRGG